MSEQASNGDSDRDRSAAPEAEHARVVVFGPFLFDRRSGALVRDETEIPLTAKTQDLLACLLEQPGRVVPKEELLERVWSDTVVTDHSLTEAIRTLRKALGDDPKRPRFIKTVHRKGYRFIARVSFATGAGNRHDLARIGNQERDEPELEQPFAATGPPSSASWRPSARLAFWATIATASVAAILGLLFRGDATDTGRPFGDTTYVELSWRPGLVEIGNRAGLAIARDGMSIAFLGVDSETWGGSLFIRRLDREDPVRIGKDEFAQYQPTFSPDGSSLAYFEYGYGDSHDRFALKIVSASGGPAVVRVEGLSFPLGASWSESGTIYFSTRDEPGLWAVEATDASPKRRIVEAGPRVSYRWPQALPDGDTVIATARRTLEAGNRADIVALSLETGAEKILVEGGGRALYASSEHLLIGRDDRLLAVPFDLDRLEPTGIPLPVLDDIAGLSSTDYAAFDVSTNGDLVYVSGEQLAPSRRQLVLLDPDGDRASPLGEPLPGAGFVASPDGRRLAFFRHEGPSRDIFISDLERGGSAQRLTNGLNARGPIWTPEGNRVVYSAWTGASYDLYWSVVATGQYTPLVVSEFHKTASDWSPDGRMLSYDESHPDHNRDIWLLPMDTREPVLFLRTEASEWGAVFSPDGKYVAYHTDESGRYEIWIRPVPEHLAELSPGLEGQKWRVTTDGGGWPVWAPDGKSLYFRNPDPQPATSIWEVPIDWRPEPVPGRPVLRAQGSYARYASPVFANGDLLLARSVGQTESRPPHLELRRNWFAELIRLVPPGR